MRFSAPRSPSPPPVRLSTSRINRSRSSFRYPSDSESDLDDIYSDDDDLFSSDAINLTTEISLGSLSETSESSASSDESDDSDFLAKSPILKRKRANEDEGREIEEVVASIRNRTQYRDPYDEWERQTRKDAFHSARKLHISQHKALRSSQQRTRQQDHQLRKASIDAEFEEMQRRMASMDLQRQQQEQKLREAWKERDRRLWEKIEAVIKLEEEKLRKKLEVERKAKEEEERKRRMEEEKRKVDEEKRRKELEEKTKQEQEERARKEQEDRDGAERQAAEEKRRELERGAEGLRTSIGVLRPDELWDAGFQGLKTLKMHAMRVVKGPKAPDPPPLGYQAPPAPPLKKVWSAARRAMTPKVGQITDDPAQIARVTQALAEIIAPQPTQPPELHHALLSSLSKALIRQAETEVTAHKEAAGPLAQVAMNLISAYPLLGDIFWAKLCEIVGCWIVPIEPLNRGFDGAKLDKKWQAKVWSVRDDETLEMQVNRITGVLRLYFHMLFAPVNKASPAHFRPARYWSYVSQLLNSPTMLQRPAAPEALYVALDVAGVQARAMWGKQWIKLLAFIYQSLQDDQRREKFGGKEVIAQASRARCILEIEKIMSSPSVS